MKLKIILSSIMIFFSLSINSQEIIIEDNDTMITITPGQVKLINKLFIDWRSIKEENRCLDSIIYHKDNIINLQEETISNKNDIILAQEEINKITKKKYKKKLIGLYTSISLALTVIVALSIWK